MNRQRDAHLDVADAVRITAVQNDAVAGNLLVLLQIKDVSHPQFGGCDFNHHVAPEYLHLGAVRLLPVRETQHANLVRFRSLDVIAGFSGGVVHGLFTEMVLNSYDITRNALPLLVESQS